MPSLDFQQFESSLLQAGIAPRHVRRTIVELKDHLQDIVDAEQASGCDLETARNRAIQEFGDLQDVAHAMRARPELLSWAFRFPRIAAFVYPLTCLALLPVVPVFAGVAHAPQLARWALCLLSGAFVTASMFLILQLTIALT